MWVQKYEARRAAGSSRGALQLWLTGRPPHSSLGHEEAPEEGAWGRGLRGPGR